MTRSQRYVKQSLKRRATMSIAARVAGISSLSMPAESSTSASAEASSGSMKPADRPIATQLRCQNFRR